MAKARITGGHHIEALDFVSQKWMGGRAMHYLYAESDTYEDWLRKFYEELKASGRLNLVAYAKGRTFGWPAYMEAVNRLLLELGFSPTYAKKVYNEVAEAVRPRQ